MTEGRTAHLARAKVHLHRPGGSGIIDGIKTGAAVDGGRACTGAQHIAPGTPEQLVIAAPAGQRIVAVHALQHIGGSCAHEMVRIGRTQHLFDADERIACRKPRACPGGHQINHHNGCGIGIIHAVIPFTTIEQLCRDRGQKQVIAKVGRWRCKANRDRACQMPKPEEICRGKIGGRQCRTIGGLHLQHLIAKGDGETIGARHPSQAGQIVDPAPFRQINPVCAQLKIRDRVGGPIRRQHKDIRIGTTRQRIGPLTIRQHIAPGPAAQPIGPRPTKKLVTRRPARLHIRARTAGLRQIQRAKIHPQPRDARAFARHKHINAIARCLCGQRRDIGHAQARPIQHRGHQHQPAIWHQREQVHPVIRPTRQHECAPRDGNRCNGLHRIKPRIQCIDHMIGHRQHAVRIQPQHGQRI